MSEKKTPSETLPNHGERADSSIEFNTVDLCKLVSVTLNYVSQSYLTCS